ncbi:MAG TPA: hypothetical protein VGB18_02705, partial [Candidatus Thermoplasmatota archaeon]
MDEVTAYINCYIQAPTDAPEAADCDRVPLPSTEPCDYVPDLTSPSGPEAAADCVPDPGPIPCTDPLLGCVPPLPECPSPTEGEFPVCTVS